MKQPRIKDMNNAIDMARDAIELKCASIEDAKWLDYETNKAVVNVSRILQEALIVTLKLERRM